MEVKQIYPLVNDTLKEMTGIETILKEDLSNLVDVGTELFNANSVDHFTKTLVDQIGKVIFVVRKYTGSAPSVMMTAWEYGAVLEKIRSEMPDAVENESWELEDGASYDQDIFYKPLVGAKFFSKRTTFEIDRSVTDDQVKSAFQNAQQMNSFIEMLFNEVDKKLQVSYDALIMRTINNMIGETINDEYQGASLSSKSGVRAVNLLKLYNDETGESLTKEKALKDLDFLKFACYTIKWYADAMKKMSTLFNVGGKQRFTPTEYLHIVLNSRFSSASSVYLQSDTFHKELVALPQAEEVPMWQGSGTSLALEDVTKIDVKTASGNDVEVSYVIGCMFDRDALGVTNYKQKVTTHYNAKAEFTNYFYKAFAGYFNDLDENFVVFFLA